jgi:hypothetical protein
MYPAKKAYLDRAKQPRNLNLEIRDIPGTYPLPYADRIQQKILTGNNDRSRSPNQRTQANYRPTNQRLHDELPRQNPDLLVSTHLVNEPGKKVGRTPSPVYAPTNGRKYNDHNPSMIVNNPLANYADVSPNRNVQVARHNDATSTKGRSESRSITPEYKYVGATEKKSYTHKADLRYEVTDINQKKSRWAHLAKPSPKEIEQLNNYKHLQQLDKYDRGISPNLINKEVQFHNGRRIDATKIVRSNSQTNVPGPLLRPSVYDYANSALKNLDKDHYVKKREAEFFMQNNPMVLRDGQQTTYKPTNTQPTHNPRSYRY